jgi:hypothetical protein
MYTHRAVPSETIRSPAGSVKVTEMRPGRRCTSVPRELTVRPSRGFLISCTNSARAVRTVAYSARARASVASAARAFAACAES